MTATSRDAGSATVVEQFFRVNPPGPGPGQVRTCACRIPARSPAADRLLDRAKRHGSGGATLRRLSEQEAILAVLDQFFALSIHESVGHAPSPFVLRANRDFCRKLVRALSPAGAVLLQEVRRGDTPVAFLLSVVHRDTLAWYESAGIGDSVENSEIILRDVLLFAREQEFTAIDVTRAGEAVRAFADRTGSDALPSWVPDGPGPERSATTRGATAMFLHEVVNTAQTIIRRKKIVEDHRRVLDDGSDADQYYDKVVSIWGRPPELQKAEARIFNEFRGELGRMRMLDIGAGTGRTSVFFGRAARDYVAIEIAPAMLQVCRDGLGDYIDPSRFSAGDARNLGSFPDGSFDFVLFSFNGIDCVSLEDRAKVLGEVRRVGRKGGWFCFSSHNMDSLTWRGARNPREFLRRLRRYALLSAANPGLPELARQSFASICDGGQHYRFPLIYINLQEQFRQLEAMGFSGIRAFSPGTGEELDRGDIDRTCVESWIYYLCRI